MAIRVTTGGTLYTYRSNLMRSAKTLNDAMTKVMTQRHFNSYAEDPAAATQAFQLRRSFWRTSAQATNNVAVINTYNSAWSAIEDVIDELGSNLANVSALRGLSDSTASGRQPLGKTLQATAESIVQTMNVKYGDEFIFAGADGLNVPLTWGNNGELLYRGIPVDSGKVEVPDPSLPQASWPQVGDPLYDADWEAFYKDQDNLAKLQSMEKESTYVDIGLGLSYDASGNLITTSAFDSSFSALSFLGYGYDQDGDPQNIVSIMKQLGDIFTSCDENGSYARAGDAERADRLTDKLQAALSSITVKHTEMDAKATFLHTNLERLETSADTLNEQILSIEQIDPADAITAYTWAQYCYNAALQIGTSILSQSLLDYMK